MALQAVILVGGQGTRLRPLTATRPKPMMPLFDRPMVAHQIDHLVRYGVRDVVFSCGYRPDALEAHFGDGSAFGVRLRYVVDPKPLGTAGAVANALPAFDHLDDVLVLNGDILTDLDLEDLQRAHVASGAAGTIALTPVEDPSAYGLVRLREDRSVDAFLEKPGPEQLIPGEPYLINAGTYLLSHDVIRMIPEGVSCSIEREIFPVVAEQRRLYGYPSEVYWRDIGTPRSYLDAHRDMLDGAVPTAHVAGDNYVGPGTVVENGARIADRSCVGAGCTVGEDAVVVGSVLGARTTVGADARIDGCVLGEGIEVGTGARLSGLVVVGDRAVIGAGVVIDGPAVIDVDEVRAAAGVTPGEKGSR
jgi:mannose-1-phosphate guanylyltransferase